MSGNNSIEWGKVATGAAAALLVVAGWATIFVFATAPNVPATAPAMQPLGAPMVPAATPHAALSQTVMYRWRSGFDVCTRHTLHACTLTFSRNDDGDRSMIQIGPLDIGPADDCETINRSAFQQCSDAGTPPFSQRPDGGLGPSQEWLACAAMRGMLYRGALTTSRVDPRDEDRSLRSGDARLQCNEGFLLGHFDNTL